MKPISVAHRVRFGREFLERICGELHAEDVMPAIGPADVERFFVTYAASHQIATRRCMRASLRRLLRFAAERGLASADLAEAVPSVYAFRLSSVPVGIKDEDIDRVVSSLAPDSETRSRDRAILLVLGTYGVRTGQVVDLRVGDVCWTEKRIEFRGQKGGRAVRHVLTPAVAEGLALYLRYYRPPVEHDYVFVRRGQPSAPLSDAGVRAAVSRRIREAGVVDGPRCPRAFRYALASRLLAARQPFKVVSDALGHQSPRATACYAKVNRLHLMEAALEWQDVTE